MCWCSLTKEKGLLPTVELIFQHPHIPHPAERDDGFLVLERKLNNDSLYWQTRANWYHMSEESRSSASFYLDRFSIFLSYTHAALWETLITFGLITWLHQTSSYCLIWTKNLHRYPFKAPQLQFSFPRLIGTALVLKVRAFRGGWGWDWRRMLV